MLLWPHGAEREGQGGKAVANEESDVGEGEEDSSQHNAVGDPTRAAATGEIDSTHRDRGSVIYSPHHTWQWNISVRHYML